MFKYKVLRDVNLFCRLDEEKVREARDKRIERDKDNVLRVTTKSDSTGRQTMLPVVVGVLEEFQDFDEEKDYLFISETLLEEIIGGLKKIAKGTEEYFVTNKLNGNRLDWNVLRKSGKTMEIGVTTEGKSPYSVMVYQDSFRELRNKDIIVLSKANHEEFFRKVSSETEIRHDTKVLRELLNNEAKGTATVIRTKE